VAHEETQRIYGERKDLVLAKSATEALQGADALAIVTEWQEFRSPDFEMIASELQRKVIFDGRNLYDPAFVKRFGLKYFAIGRGDSVC
jgi:UDPglucose 6-dehydrogenase